MTPADKTKTPTWAWWVAAAIAVALIGNACSSKSNAPPTAVNSSSNGLSNDSKTKLAAMINLSGQLCATVTDAFVLGNDVYNITCQRYRDGTGTATYQVDLKTGAVK